MSLMTGLLLDSTIRESQRAARKEGKTAVDHEVISRIVYVVRMQGNAKLQRKIHPWGREAVSDWGAKFWNA